MQLLHIRRKTRAQFDEPNLVSCAGLVPVMRLAERCGLSKLIDENVRIASSARPVAKGNPGVNPHVKIPAIVAGMVAGADSIDDLDVIRHGGMGKLFGGTYAPSSLGSHLRAYDHGNVAQLEKTARALLVQLAAHTPLLPDVGKVCYVDIDDFRRRVYGHKKQGAKFGPVKVGGYLAKLRNLDPIIASISTPTAAPVVAAARLRGGNAASARGAGSFVREALCVARAVITAASRPAGVPSSRAEYAGGGLVLVRLDSSFYNAKAIGAVCDAGAYFSVTARMDTAIQATIAGIGNTAQAWTPIKYPQAVWDDQLRCWVSDAEVAVTCYTAFASTEAPVTAKLLVRRVKDKNTTAAKAGQDELFGAWRYHAVFTNNPMAYLQAEQSHRAHAVVEQLNADLIAGPLAHMPSGWFSANSAWVTCAAIAHNLLRASGTLASAFYAKARGKTLRTRLINIPARLARSGRDQITLHLPDEWPWQIPWENLFTATHGPPTAA